MGSEEIRKKFLDFFAKEGHKVVPSSSLIPDDPSVLLTTAGMQQFKKYYTGEADPEKDFGTRNTASIQKSFRTSDIDEVGDESHLTFFEMLGNFSFGGYFKEDAIKYAYDFFKEIDLPIEYVTIFGGDSEVPADTESEKIWRNLGVTRIEKRGREDNFWGPTGNEGPCGPTTEIYANGIEIWNIVFNEYYCNPDKTLTPLKQNGVDTGMGLERLAMVVQKKKNIFETDLFDFIMQGFPDKLPMRTRRIIADHIRGIPFLISDGLRPSNKGAGYMLRRLIRRVIAFTYDENIGVSPNQLLKSVVTKYSEFPDYRNLKSSPVEEVFMEEYEKFMKTLGPVRKEFEREADKVKARGEKFMPKVFVFGAHQSSGATIDILDDFAKKEGVEIDKEVFARDLEHHQEISRAGAEAKFGGHGVYLKTGELTVRDPSELGKVTRLHTATHLLHAALRAVLGPEVKQNGSDITVERTRFDFTFPRKLTLEEIKKVEDWVNDIIERDAKVEWQEMPYEEAVKTGALSFFREKYPPRVKVYTVFEQKTGEVLSKELCGGPHVAHTGEIGRFRITKEESSSAGVRRIRAVVE